MIETTLLFRNDEALKKVQDYLTHSIPLFSQMGIQATRLDESGLQLSARLHENRNHIGTAFGGSLHGVATLACWGLVWILLRDEGDAEVVVQESSMQYLAPVKSDFVGVCQMPERAQLEKLLNQYRRRGRARIELHGYVDADGQSAAEFKGTFVALRGKGEHRLE